MTFILFVNDEDKLTGMFSVPVNADLSINKAKGIRDTEKLLRHWHAGKWLKFKWSEKLVKNKYLKIPIQ